MSLCLYAQDRRWTAGDKATCPCLSKSMDGWMDGWGLFGHVFLRLACETDDGDSSRNHVPARAERLKQHEHRTPAMVSLGMPMFPLMEWKAEGLIRARGWGSPAQHDEAARPRSKHKRYVYMHFA